MNDQTDPNHDVPSAPPRRRYVALAVVGCILLVGAIGLNGAVASLKLSFKKLAVPLRAPVQTIPAEIGPWVQVSPEVRFSPEIEAELNSLDYIDRWYVDLRKADADVRREWEAATVKDAALKGRLQANVMKNDPFGAVKMHVVYYTGGVDTVPHIPDRCMVAGGFDPTGKSVARLDLGDGRTMDASFVQFEQHAGYDRPQTLSIAYFFQVNGDYEWDAITGVRKRLQNLFEKYGYFAKIECMTASPETAAAPAQAAIGDFLHFALPAVERVLPDWQQVIRQDPAEKDAGR